uniref:RagB/SusD family nutrient uptake outer membrane protein n=1 Tax=Mariniphaga sediminis TaxID=1628158 RepID=UPI00356620E1
MNKKNIKIGLLKLLGVCVCVVSMLSCEDLVEDPRAELTPENFFQTEDDLAAAVSACFFPFMGHSWQGFDVRGFSLEAGDDQYTSRQGSNKERVLEFDEFGVTSGNVDIANSWQMIYQSIAACNAVINNGAGIEMDEEKKQQYLGQAYFVRSLMYFYLVRWYGNIPLVLELIEGEGTDIIRTDKEIVYQQIIDDAKMAENKLPKSWVDGGRPTLGAAKTLLSSIYLVSAGWPMNKTENYLLAAQKAKEVIEMGVYDLFDSYEDIWLLENENKKEWIFAMQGSINGGTPSKFGQPFMPPEESGWVDYFSEPHFFHIFP